ncbi:MAG TPA: efflux RND transporter periplasmic adaptor subunit [Xanthobacteraceae bacterium]|nr:efflux RND transporter periplasmic adaptor subunit [Xanthobacteraceae bacterium]
MLRALERRTLIAGGAIALAALALLWILSGFWGPGGAAAQSKRGNGRGDVAVEVATATKKRVPLQSEALGTVTPMASVAIKSRVDTEIVGVHFNDGAYVNKGDLLFTLDSRLLEAQLREKQGTLARDSASLAGAERDMKRYSELFAKGATTQTNLDNATTQTNVLRAQTAADQSAIDELEVQISYCTIRAPISGRVSMAAVKVGNLVRAADQTPLATIIQSAPVYVSFGVPQRYLPDLREAIGASTATVEASIPGDKRKASGQVSMIENTVDPATGTVTVRATMPNADQILWPGSLVSVKLTYRMEEAIAVPTAAVQYGQSGPFVFVVKDRTAMVQPVTVERTVEGESVITKGLNGGEAVVITGHLLLSNGSRVTVRQPKAGA